MAGSDQNQSIRPAGWIALIVALPYAPDKETCSFRHLSISLIPKALKTKVTDTAATSIDISIDHTYRFIYSLYGWLTKPTHVMEPRMNAFAQIVEHLQAIDSEILDLTSRPMQIELMEQRLEQARASLLKRLGGHEELTRLHQMAIQSLYAEQREGRSLD